VLLLNRATPARYCGVLAETRCCWTTSNPLLVPGFHLTLHAPCATSVALNLSMAVLPKARLLARHGLDLNWPCHRLRRRSGAKPQHSVAEAAPHPRFHLPRGAL
jgi:hypothetical protein